MRIQLRDDRGAVAVLVAFLAVTLVGLAAFAVDAGSGYAAKRQISHAADAAALGGAGKLTDYDGDCTTISGNATAVNDARNTADSYLTRNRNNTTRTGFSVSCSSDNKSVDVYVADHGTVQGVLSGVFGINQLQANREATAEIGVPNSTPGLRPYAICASDLGDLQPSDPPQAFYMPEAGCGQPPGNWYSLDCPPTHTNGTPVIADNTIFGCDSDIHIVDTSTATTAAQKISMLDAACPPSVPSGGTSNPGCMTANTGNLPANGITQAFDFLLGIRDKNGNLLATPRNPLAIVLPVFFPGSVEGSGENAVYPVYALVGASICAYHFQNQGAMTTMGKCAGAVPLVQPVGAQVNNWDAIELVGRRVQITGSTGSPTCAVGDPTCDFGVRSVHLIK